MANQQIMVIDEGTTSTRAMLFRADGKHLATRQRDLTQYYPKPGLVEHDAAEIWERTLACAQEIVADAGGPQAVAAIGITNQRETVIAWDRRSGEPLTRAIVWQDRRTDATCHALKDAGHEPLVQAKTGLLLDPYFSASKMQWMLQNIPAVAAAGEHLCFGTVESYLIFRLTGGLHISDASNASRTMLLALDANDWDEELCTLFSIPRRSLPEIRDCAGDLGTTIAEYFGAPIAITGSAGDQQAATIGQGCLTRGDTKATFGTGAFILSNSGKTPPKSNNRLLATVLCQVNGQRHYALEGSIFAAGSVIKWLRDDVEMIGSASDSEALARSVTDTGGVVIVPALSGLGAPHWRADVRAAITGLSFATRRAHIVRAALEAMAHQCHDLKAAFAADGVDWGLLKVDGGMVANDWLVQDLADMLDINVKRPTFFETTALGAAMLAAVGCDIYPDISSATAMIAGFDSFVSSMDPATRTSRIALWETAVAERLSA
ncbi:MAG: glycerol kinase [Parasphingorhabdus sp.]|nr:glycerol kinase [Parasphingorhabdus sp.]